MINLGPASDNPCWLDAQLALLALQVSPCGFGGVWLRAGHGPVRDLWLYQLQASITNIQKIPLSVDDDRLLGGIDLTLTLQSGKLTHQNGLLANAHGGLVVLPMAERFSPQLVSILCQTQDRGYSVRHASDHITNCRFGIVALDESDEDEPGLSANLADRLGIWLDLHGVTRFESGNTLTLLEASELAAVQGRLQRIVPEEQIVLTLCELASALGINSMRSIYSALHLVCVHAALHGRYVPDDDDVAFSARMVLGPRATRLPQFDVDEAIAQNENSECAPSEPLTSEERLASEDTTEPLEREQNSSEPAQELLLSAALASLPTKLLDTLKTGKVPGKSLSTSGSLGQAARSNLRGRPLAPRPGKPGSGKRLHLLSTLRAAAPKQRIRQSPLGTSHIAIRYEDFHVRRYEQRRPTCLIFALDASGSAAQQRLAEAKGAVELLLEQSYARRDSVCVVAFRGKQAQLLLPPTRSLVRAKRELAGLPGGGGTPLASGIQAALLQADLLQRGGATPLLVVLSDGRANVALSGMGGRIQAQSDANALAEQWCNKKWGALWIDTSKQPDPAAQQLAASMGAVYFPMPYVEAKRMALVVDDLLTRQRSS
jgi:magnesium chelatase subunit D